jgi:hypothetical protein
MKMADMTVDQKQLLEQIRTIRHALHIGLESFGEVERVIDQYEGTKGSGGVLDPLLRPVHPTGTSNTVSAFAAALRELDMIEPELL